jgi:hypothetical protein
MKFDLKILGAALIKFTRAIFKIQPLWNKELEILSGGTTEE